MATRQPREKSHTLRGMCYTTSVIFFAMPTHPTTRDLIARLSRIEGQIGALKRSLNATTAVDCAETLYQVKAATNGLKRFGEAFSRAYAKRCLSEKMSATRLSHELDTIINSAFILS